MEIHSSRKTYVDDVHRVVPPNVTVRRIRSLLERSGRFGDLIVERLDQKDIFGVPVYRIYQEGDNYLEHGKGLIRAQAMASGLMEFVERYSALRPVPSAMVMSTKEGLGDEAVSYWDLVPERRLAEGSSREEVDRLKMYWTRAWSLTRQQDVYVPGHLVYTHIPYLDTRWYCTNGLGAGNTMEEALVHAICEVVERHQEEFINRNHLPVDCIDQSTIISKPVLWALKLFRKNGFEVHLADYSGDLGIPTVQVLAIHPAEKTTHAGWCMAHGTHTDPAVAMVRVLSELCQTRAVYIKNTEDGTHEEEQQYASLSIGVRRMLKERQHSRPMPFSTLPDVTRDDIGEEVEELVKRLDARGFEVIASDITHPHLKVPCVRVIVRDMQPTFHNKYVVPGDDQLRISRHLDRKKLFGPSVYSPDSAWPEGWV